jgi:hypothetical protein
MQVRSLHRVPRALAAGALALWATVPSSTARADATIDAGGAVACESLARELAVSRTALDEARARTTETAGERDECRATLNATTDRLGAAESANESVTRAKDRQCAATSSYVDEILRGQKPHPNDCVPPDEQARVTSELESLAHASSALIELDEYGEGAVDALVPSSFGSSKLDLELQRITGSGRAPSLVYRRLLSEALRLVAPHAWHELRTGGSAAFEAFYSGSGPLDARLIDEARNAPSGATGPAGPPVSAALRLVLGYEHLAACDHPSLSALACVRARQLQQLLESSGPLVVRRRTEDIWAADCASISPTTTIRWLEDLPTPQLADQPSDFREVSEAAYAKLFSCYLADAQATSRFPAWIIERLPAATRVTSRQLQRLDEIKSHWHDASLEEACSGAVRALENVATPTRCQVPGLEFRSSLERFVDTKAPSTDSPSTGDLCKRFARLLWDGKAATIAGSFARPPSVDDMIVADRDKPDPPMRTLRGLCEERRGAMAAFPDDLAVLAGIARGMGEPIETAPWRIEPSTGSPVELAQFKLGLRWEEWLRWTFGRQTSCGALGMGDARCQECRKLPRGTAYDCGLHDLLEETWAARTRRVLGALAAIVAASAIARWSRRLIRARRRLLPWLRDTATYLGDIGLTVRSDPTRWLLPTRYETMTVRLPRDGAWDRWGEIGCVVRAPDGPRVAERDVNRAAHAAQRVGALVALLVHDDMASPDLSAIRAILDWAAKGGTRAVQVLTLSTTRLFFAKSANDLLDLVEETSLRGNPFELRGRVTSSSRFYNRERLVSGLLAAAQAGHWQVVTGLRRFGKSSLALEVCRRLPGLSAYVDLAGFHQEIGSSSDPAPAADAILRYVCSQLLESARARYAGELPPLPERVAPLDVAVLDAWFRALSRACASASGAGAPPLLVVFDEIEQILTFDASRLRTALDILAITIGRLKSALGDASSPDRGARVSVFLCSALHPLLWAPLSTLAHQSIMGSFPSVCVPCLTESAASDMMRSLGSRQGIRFTDSALSAIVREAQGVPLLVRRIGSSVLELYDPERARQGALGAVEIGLEGATEAVRREVQAGSPLRVWVESEICEATSPAGAMLRLLAMNDRVSTSALREAAMRRIRADFERTKLHLGLPSEEVTRRIEEAASVILRLLSETGLLLPLGDLTSPEAYALPDGAIRRILRSRAGTASSVTEFPSAHHEP